MYIFDDLIETTFGSYLLKTSSDIKNNLIVSTLFSDGTVIHKYNFTDENLRGDELLNLVSQKHSTILEELNQLLNLLNSNNQLSFDIQFTLAKILGEIGFYKDVIPFLEKLLDKNESRIKEHEILFYLANINDKIGNVKNAISYYERVIQLKPNYSDYINRYGEVLLKLENTLDAITLFKKAIELNKYYSDAHYNLALAYLQNYINKVDYELSMTFPDSCIKELEIAIELNPSFKTKNYFLGKEDLLKENWQKAFSCLFRVKEKNNCSYGNEFILKFYLKFLNDEDLTIEDMREYIQKLEDMIKLHPNYPDLFNELGIAYILFGKLLSKSGIQQFKQALKLNKNYKKAIKNLKLMENESLGYDIVLKAIIR